jgi:hypothetical protein
LPCPRAGGDSRCFTRNRLCPLGRTIKKKAQKTKGESRRLAAATLWENQLNGDPMAIAACEELLGEATYFKIRNYVDGCLVLKKKMRSL